jgi:hypothetical protein
LDFENVPLFGSETWTSVKDVVLDKGTCVLVSGGNRSVVVGVACFCMACYACCWLLGSTSMFGKIGSEVLKLLHILDIDPLIGVLS